MHQGVKRPQRDSTRIAACVDEDETDRPLREVEGELERDGATERLAGNHRLRYLQGSHEIPDELGVAAVRADLV